MGESSSFSGSTSTFDEIHNPAYYSDMVRCVVPTCGKWRRDYSELRFFPLPRVLQVIWCKELKRNCPKRVLYVCADHINIEKDCYQTKNGKLNLKLTAKLNISSGFNEDACMEKQNLLMNDTNFTHSSKSDHYKKNTTMCDAATQYEKNSRNKGIQVKPATSTVGTSIRVYDVPYKVMPSQPLTLTSSAENTTGSSTLSIFEPSSSSTCSSNVCGSDLKKNSGPDHILKLIEQDPKCYIGVPKCYYWFIRHLALKCNINHMNILIALFKIKQNDSMKRISAHFGFSKPSILEKFKNTLPVLAGYLQNFIFLPNKVQIKKTLPPVFKIRFSNVQCLIDCFEIEIEKPSDPLRQAQTWSQYKSCNTIKYLIGCCPNGFVCFVSKGFGGRISDKAITELSGLIDVLPPGAVILADRGFKGLEAILNAKNIKLLRPPSVTANEKPTKQEVIQGKVIASLRVHIERVIRRVREFNFLKPHSVVKHNHVYYLDECVIIACALINLQGNLIKDC